MTIAVLSDSHIGQSLSAFPPKFLAELPGFDVVIHCGDYTSPVALGFLQDAADFFGVSGNMDDSTIQMQLPDVMSINLCQKHIAITHGWGAPQGLAQKVYAKITGEYPNQKFDIILYGHSHLPSDQIIEGTRMINPGALCGNIGSKYGSYGLLTINERTGDYEWRLFQISPRSC